MKTRPAISQKSVTIARDSVALAALFAASHGTAQTAPQTEESGEETEKPAWWRWR